MALKLIPKTGDLCRVELLPPDPRPSQRNPSDDPATAREALRALATALDALEIPYFIADGTLLGLMRDGTFIPGDNDIDIKLPGSALTEAFFTALSEAGFVLFKRAFFEGTLRNSGFSFRNIYLDVNSIEVDAGVAQYHIAFGRGKADHATGYLTYQFAYAGREKFDFDGITLWRPKDPTGFLSEFYGPGWRTPVPGWNHFFDPPGLVAVTGPPELLARATRRWFRALGLPQKPPRARRPEKTKRWKNLFRWS